MEGSKYPWKFTHNIMGSMSVYALRIGWLVFFAYVEDGKVGMLERAGEAGGMEFTPGIAPVETDIHIQRVMEKITSAWSQMNG
jgi:hypothetical protein